MKDIRRILFLCIGIVVFCSIWGQFIFTVDIYIKGFDSLNVNTAHVYVQSPSLVPDGKLITTWGYIRALP